MVGKIPRDIDDKAAKAQYEVYPWHDPLEKSYSHSEIRCKKRGGDFDRNREPSRTARLDYRRSLHLVAVFEKRPMESSANVR